MMEAIRLLLISMMLKYRSKKNTQIQKQTLSCHLKMEVNLKLSRKGHKVTIYSSKESLNHSSKQELHHHPEIGKQFVLKQRIRLSSIKLKAKVRRQRQA